MDAVAVDEILARLRRRGGRSTPARRAIVSELVARGGHVTAEELTAAVQADHPDVHASTVYRCLDALAETGAVEHIHLAHGATVFHLVSHEHQHLRCDRCGAVQEIPAEVFARAIIRIDRDFGFQARPGHVAVPGLCRACRRV